MKLVGKIKEAHGLKGEIYVLLFGEENPWWPKLKQFGVGVLPPVGEEASVDQTLTCARVKPFKKGLLIQTGEVSDRTAAEGLTKKGFFVPDDFFISKPGETIFLGEILHFTLKDPDQTTLGTIADFSSNGPQDLLVIDLPGGRRAEVPFVQAFLRKIDFAKKSVVMDLPEGLLDLDAVAADESH